MKDPFCSSNGPLKLDIQIRCVGKVFVYFFLTSMRSNRITCDKINTNIYILRQLFVFLREISVNEELSVWPFYVIYYQ